MVIKEASASLELSRISVQFFVVAAGPTQDGTSDKVSNGIAVTGNKCRKRKPFCESRCVCVSV